MDITLSPFPAQQQRHAAEIASWVVSADEAAAWAGTTTGFPVTAEQFDRWHQDPDVRAFVGMHDGETMAYGELWADADEQEIELARILVHPQHRGQGIGRALVRSLADRAGEIGGADFRILIRVVPENFAAIRCYRGAGFATLSSAEQQESNRGQPREYVWLARQS